MKRTKALVVLSGGQDSVTCLAWALKTFSEVEAITFVYGQRHKVELYCAQNVCEILNVPQTVVDVSFFGAMSTSALTNDGDISATHPLNDALPASFVPNRNALFLTVAHAHAQNIAAGHVVTGVCQTDYSGYPDCRDGFIRDLNAALNLGSDSNVFFHTPLMHLTKAETFAFAHKLDALDLVVERSHTCYEGDRTRWHEWGAGCGECPACVLRAKGWVEFVRDAIDAPKGRADV